MRVHRSSSTPAAYEEPRDSVEWVQLSDATRDRLADQQPPGVRYHWHKVIRVSTYHLPPLPPR